MNRLLFTHPDDEDTHLEQYQFEEEPFNTVAELILFYLEEQRFISQLSGALIQTPITRDGLPDTSHMQHMDQQTSSRNSSISDHPPQADTKGTYYFGESPAGVFGDTTMTQCRLTRQSQSMMILETTTTTSSSGGPGSLPMGQGSSCFEGVFQSNCSSASLPRPKQAAGLGIGRKRQNVGDSRLSSDDLLIQEMLKKSPSFESNPLPVVPPPMPPLVCHAGQEHESCASFDEDIFPQDIDVRTLTKVISKQQSEAAPATMELGGAPGSFNGPEMNSCSSCCSSPLSLPPPTVPPPPMPAANSSCCSSPRSDGDKSTVFVTYKTYISIFSHFQIPQFLG